MIRVLHDILSKAASESPAKPAVFLKNESMTYAEIGAQASQLAFVLAGFGVRKGDRVGFFLEKCFEKVVSIFGISEAGGVFVPIRRLSHGNQAAHIVSDSGSAVLITTYSRLSILASVLSEMPGLRTVLAIGKEDPAAIAALEEAAAHLASDVKVKVVDWKSALASASSETPAFKNKPRVVEPDLAAILYTSGSTGKPKGVVLSHLNLVAGAYTVSEFLKIGPNDKLLSILTFGFDYGLNQLTSAFLHQAQIVLLDYLFAKDIIEYARKHEITGIGAVAATWIQLMQFQWDGSTLPKLRYVTNSGGAIPEEYVRELRRRIPQTSIYLMYGLTEAFRSTFLDPALVDKHPTSMGKAIPGEEILILDEHGKPVKAGETGELVHRGVLVALGYWNAPDLTAIRYRRNPMQSPEVPIPEMVVFSGDQVRIDEEGLLYFVGRKDEMIKSAGNRISPTEIEEVLYASGLVAAAVALGVPHDIYGQSVFAVIAPKDAKEFGLEALKKYCQAQMPAYMIPAAFEIRESIPYNSNGKLDRAMVSKQVYAKLGVTKK
jgi:acyl-CoA ligase (AMP-forming) (exosortase A-associated)